MSIQPYLKTVLQGENLSYSEASAAATQLMETELNPIQVSALLAGPKAKGENY